LDNVGYARIELIKLSFVFSVFADKWRFIVTTIYYAIIVKESHRYDARLITGFWILRII
jgi:hypothetical protein